MDDIIKSYKRYFKIQNAEYNNKLNKLVEDFIAEKGLIIYGGYAIDQLVRQKSDVGLYDFSTDEVDYDVYSMNHDEDARQFAQRLKDHGFEYIRIVTGISPDTRKVFVNFADTAILDITLIDMEKFKKINPVKIGRFLFADPQFLKIDQYVNLSMNLFEDAHRMEKARKKVLLLEEYFPLPALPTSDSTAREQNPAQEQIRKLTQEPNIIIGGPFVANYYLHGIPSGEIHELDIINECFYQTIPFEGIQIRICTINHLLYSFYKLRFDENGTTKYDHFIRDLIDKFGIPIPDLSKVQLYIPEQRTTKDSKSRLPTFFLR